MKTLKKYLSMAGEWLFPSFCGICQSRLLTLDEAWYGLCGECRRGIAVDRGERCPVCGRPLISEKGRCLSCREKAGETGSPAPSFERLLPIFPYAGKYRTLLEAYKFGKSRGAARFLEEKFWEGLSLLPLGEMKNPVLVPVPPRPGKIKKTGWDQIEALARIIKARRREPGALPVYPCLKRLPSQSQKTLNREERRSNLRGKILCR
ncbi:MAG: double zinc ribbon domain-containing protein, partial [Spirochaetaceae bacterium]|nr:double zinc ribbon domain-containing protein [Spirochaetaceae bacterium]